MKRFLNQIEHNIAAFTSIFDSINDLVIIVERDGKYFRFTYANPIAKRILNVVEHLEGRRIEDVVSIELANLLISKYDQSLTTQESLQMELKLETEDDIFIGEAFLNPILTKDDECKYVVSIVKDVTDKRREEIELKETKKQLEISQKKLISFIENNVDAVFEFDSEGYFIDINEKACQITGYKKNELVGISFMPLVAKQDLEETLSHFKEALDGYKAEYETTFYHRNGQEINLLIKNVPIKVENKIVGVYGMAKDITEQKKISRLLAENEQKYKSLFENHPDAIFSFDLKGNIISGNPAVERLTGYTMDFLLDKPFLSLIQIDDIEKAQQYFHVVITKKAAFQFDLRICHQRGMKVDVSVLNIPILVNERVIGVFVVAQDITEQRRARKALVETKEQLEKMAFYDHLSGLPNRRTFDDRLDMSIQMADRTKKKVAVMMIDGREFKKVNDTFGHDAGDAVIKELAKRIQKSVRKTDTVARIGGDEIGIILPELGSKTIAEDIAKRIIKSLDAPLLYKNNIIKLGAGIGIAIYPDHAEKLRQLLKFADEALYDAKESKRNEYRFYGIHH